MLEFAHGVGRVYESPIPVSYYLGGAALTVLASFFIRAFSKTERAHPWRQVGGTKLGARIEGSIRGYLLAVFVLLIAFAVIYWDRGGAGIPPFIFWICLIIIPIVLCSVFASIWPAASPWATIEGLYRFVDEDEVRPFEPAPAWVPPLLIYGFFWFELVSGKGFDSTAILGILLVYTGYVLTLQRSSPWARDEADPLGILFGFAQRIAPLEIREGKLFYRGFVSDLDQPNPMPLGLFLAVFMLLGSTTLDNMSETVQWFQFLDAIGLEDMNEILLGSIALVAFAIPFLLPFLACVGLARLWVEKPLRLGPTARLFGWSLIPIGIAYVLAHNMPLLVIGLPRLIGEIAEGFGSSLFAEYSPSPLLVWILEIALIVGGHVIGVLAAHRVSVRVAGSHAAALKSHVALTLLMSLFTISTLWLLSLPIVTA